jgi:hypothetical protein
LRASELRARALPAKEGATRYSSNAFNEMHATLERWTPGTCGKFLSET